MIEKKLHLTPQAVRDYVNYFKKLSIPFRMEISNYTTRLISDNANIFFIKNSTSLQTFAAAAKIKKDISQVPLPVIEESNVIYFDSAITQPFYADSIQNIDLKSAYATILFNDEMISPDTYQYLCGLKKEERLAAVGMCASRKQIFYHNKDGKVFEMETKKNNLSPFFFYCCQKTHEIIKDIRVNVLKDSFIFSWVDGIYYSNDNLSYRDISQEYIREVYRMESTAQNLTDFEAKRKKEYFALKYTDEKNRVKTFSIPVPECNLKKQIINHLLSKSYE